MRIFVVEDDRKVSGFLKKGLQEEHYAVDVCPDGRQGARRWQSGVGLEGNRQRAGN